MESFEAILEEYLQERDPEIGALVEGVILKIDRNYAFVDIGSKREALLPRSELFDAEGRALFGVGDRIQALVVKRISPEGQVLLSARKILEERALETLKRAFLAKEPVRVRVHREIKGGYEVRYQGLLTGFLPRSQAQKSLEGPSEEEVEVLVLRIDEKSFVVSQKAFAELERERKLQKIKKIIEEEGILEGRVKAKVKGGYLLDFDGVITGFLPLSELTHRRILPDEVPISEGDLLRVKVIEWIPEKGKLKVSHKALEEDPWERVLEKYAVDQRIRGRVVKVENFGAFVEIEPGLEGLLPASEISWKRGVRPADIVKVGDLIEAVITELVPEKKKLTLSLKRLEPSPWEVLAEELKVGDVIEAPIRNVTDFGLFLEVREGIDGFIHASKVAWGKVENLRELFSPGQMVRAKIIELDPERKRLLLSIRDLSPDPWETFSENFRVGDEVEGLVVRQIPGKGYLIRVGEGVIGFLPRSELARERKGKEPINSGERLKVLILELDPSQRRLVLSEQAYQRKLEEEEFQAYKTKGDSTKRGRAIRIPLDKD